MKLVLLMSVAVRVHAIWCAHDSDATPYVSHELDYHQPCTGPEMVSLCEGLYDITTQFVVSCTRVMNHLPSSSRNERPVLLPGSCVFGDPANITFTLVEPYSERVCGVGAVTASVGLTRYPTNNYMEQMTSYNVVVYSCVCYKDYVGSDVPPTITITQAVTPPGHLPSCHYVLAETKNVVNAFPSVMDNIVDTACGAFDLDLGRCLDLDSGPQYRTNERRTTDDQNSNYSHVRYSVCVCPGAYDRWDVGVHRAPLTGDGLDSTDIQYCSCQIICEDGWTDDEHTLCSVSVQSRACRARQGDLSLCVPAPMQAIGCSVYTNTSSGIDTPVLVPGSCVYEEDAITNVCGQNAVGASIVLYSQTSGWPTFQEDGWRMGYGYVSGAARWGTDHRGAVLLSDQGTSGWQLWSVPRCVCIDYATQWQFEVWQDVHAQALYNCDTWLDVAEYGNVVRTGTRSTNQCGGSHSTGAVSSLLSLPASIVTDFLDSSTPLSALDDAAELVYIGIITSCTCAPFPVQLQTAFGFPPHCSWILNSSTTLAVLPIDLRRSVDLCSLWAVQDTHWSCSRTPPHAPVRCGPGTRNISTVCPNNHTVSTQVAMSSLACIDYCHCESNVGTIHTPCDAVVLPCTRSEVAQFCGVRPSGAPFAACAVHSLIIDGNTRKFLPYSCSGYTPTWTSGCGVSGILDAYTVCTPGTCSKEHDLFRWCGPGAESCTRHGVYDQWSDLCTCEEEKDHRVANVWQMNNMNRRKYAASSCAQWPTMVYSKRRVPGNAGVVDREYTSPHNALELQANWFNLALYHEQNNSMKLPSELYEEGTASLDAALLAFSTASIASGGMGISVDTSTSISAACGIDSQGYDVVLYRGTSESIPITLLWNAWSSTVSSRPEPASGSSQNHSLVYMVRLRCICVDADSPYDEHSQWLSPDNSPQNWVQQDSRTWEDSIAHRVHAQQSSGGIPVAMCTATGRDDPTNAAVCNSTSYKSTVCSNNARCSADREGCLCGRGFRGVNSRGVVDCHDAYNEMCARGCVPAIPGSSDSCTCPGPWKQIVLDGQYHRVSACLHGSLTSNQNPCHNNSVCESDGSNNGGSCVCMPPYTQESACMNTTCYEDAFPEYPEGCRGRGLCGTNGSASCMCDRDPSGHLLWVDALCAKPWCDDGQCTNGGTCTTRGTGVPECLCRAGTYGLRCEYTYIGTNVGGYGHTDVCSGDPGLDTVIGPLDFQSSVCICQLGRYGDACQWSFNDSAVCGGGPYASSGWCSGNGNCVQTLTTSTGMVDWKCDCTEELYGGPRCADSICPVSVSTGVVCHSLESNSCTSSGLCECARDNWTATIDDNNVTDMGAMLLLFRDVVLLGESCSISVVEGCADRPIAVDSDTDVEMVRVATLCGGDNSDAGRCVVDSISGDAACECGVDRTYTDFGNVSRCQSDKCHTDCLHGVCSVYNSDICLCTDNSVWGGPQCNVNTCSEGTKPTLSSSDQSWECTCTDPRYVAPACKELECPVEHGVVCGDRWFSAPGSPGAGHDTPVFPFTHSSVMPSPTGVGCNGTSGACSCFDRVYRISPDTGTCIPLVSVANTKSLVAVHPDRYNSTLTVVCTNNSFGRPWDPATGCHSQVCSGNGVSFKADDPACMGLSSTITTPRACCCDSRFSGDNCEIESRLQVCKDNSVQVGTGCRCVYPWLPIIGAREGDETRCTVSRCSHLGSNPEMSILGDVYSGYRCNCDHLHVGEFCHMYRHSLPVRSIPSPAPTYTGDTTMSPSSNDVWSTNSSIQISNISASPTRGSDPLIVEVDTDVLPGSNNDIISILTVLVLLALSVSFVVSAVGLAIWLCSDEDSYTMPL
jgi:hypothetical protein